MLRGRSLNELDCISDCVPSGRQLDFPTLNEIVHTERQRASTPPRQKTKFSYSSNTTAARTTEPRKHSPRSAFQFTRDSFRSVRDTLLPIIAGEWGWPVQSVPTGRKVFSNAFIRTEESTSELPAIRLIRKRSKPRSADQRSRPQFRSGS